MRIAVSGLIGVAAVTILVGACGTGAPDSTGAAASPVGTPTAAELRVCADPNNLPFSNAREEGFENRIAALLAEDMHARLRYTWWAQRRGFLRNTLNARECDVVIGLPTRIEMARTTTPYYRSSYAFVTRRDRALRFASLDDAALRRLRIGVQMVGDDGANSPPAHALSQRGIIRNVVGYSVYGDYRSENPPSRIISAVAQGEVDVALAWGPLAGYFAPRQAVALDVVPLPASLATASVPFAFEISMGVRRSDSDLLARLNQFIERRRTDIDDILADYGVPLLDGPGGS